MKDLITVFTNKKNNVKKQIDELQNLINAEIAPDSERISELSNGLTDLRRSYDSIREMVRKAVGERVFPQGNKGVGSYKRLYEDVSVFKQAEDLLKKFVNVTSDNETYLDAIKPAQAEATKTLNKMQQESDHLPDITKEDLFIQTLELNTDDLRSEKGTKYLTEISKVFNMSVSLGLALKAYYLKDDYQKKAIIAENVVTSSSQKPESAGQAVVAEKAENEQTGSDTVPVREKQVELAQDIRSPEEDKKIQPVQYVEKKGKVKATEITNYEKNGISAVYFIMQGINALGILNAEQYVKVSSVYSNTIDKDNIDQREVRARTLLKELCKKGLLASFDVFCNGELYYTLSAYGNKCMKKEQVKSRMENLKIPLREECSDWFYDNEMGTTYKELKALVKANNDIIKYLLREKEFQKGAKKDKTYRQFKISNLTSDGYRYFVFPSIDRTNEYALYNDNDLWEETLEKNVLVLADKLPENITKKGGGRLLCYCERNAYFFEEGKWKLWKEKENDKCDESKNQLDNKGKEKTEVDQGIKNKPAGKNTFGIEATGEKVNNAPVVKTAEADVASDAKSITKGDNKENDVLVTNDIAAKVVLGEKLAAEAECNKLSSLGEESDIENTIEDNLTGVKESEADKLAGGNQHSDESILSATANKTNGSVQPEPEKTVKEKKLEPEDLANKLLKELTGRLLNGKNNEDEKVQEIIKALLHRGDYEYNKETGTVHDDIVKAFILARTAEKLPGCQKLYTQIALALGAFDGKKVNNSGETLTTIFTEDEGHGSVLMLAAYIYAMLFPSKAHDYTLSGKITSIFSSYDEIFEGYGWVKDLFHKLQKSRCWINGGYSEAVLNLLSSEEARERKILELQKQAEELLEVPKIKFKIVALPQFLLNCFGVESDFHLYLDAVLNNSVADSEEIREFLKEFCYVDEDGNAYEADIDRIGDYVDKNYRKANEEEKIKHRSLNSLAKSYVANEVEQRVELLMEWVGIAEESRRDDVDTLRKFKDQILLMINELLNRKEALNPENIVLRRLFEIIKQKFSVITGIKRREPFAELLRTGVFALDERGVPDLSQDFNDIMYFEPCRRMLQHIVTPVRNLKVILSDIYVVGSDVFDNLNQAYHINRFLGNDTKAADPDDIKQALRGANKDFEEFKELLELAYTYNRISELQKENLLEVARSYQEYFYDKMNFGNWRSFLGALRRQIDDATLKEYNKIKADIDDRKNSEDKNKQYRYLEKAERFLEEKNFAVAEECINRYDSKYANEIGETDSSQSKAYFNDFLKKHENIYNVCAAYTNRGKGLPTFGWTKYTDINRSKEWTKRLIASSKEFINSWPRMGLKSEENVEVYLKNLGVDVETVTSVSKEGLKANENLFIAKVNPTRGNRRDYLHPIAKFGTQMDGELYVICLQGNYPPKSITEVLSRLNLKTLSILIIDSPISLINRNKISELSHEKNAGQPACLVIDRVLMLYLSLLEETERIPAMLQCTLPYTVYQPFTVGSGPVADEMFFGRKKELESILDPNGANVVYGGRQLGKTALLQRAESFYNNKEELTYAVYINAVECDTEELLVKEIVNTFNRKIKKLLHPVKSLSELCKQISTLFINEKVKKLLLLIDEADRFLESIRSENYRRLQPLVTLMREKDISGRFKFVLAGLHNVYRAQHAMANNSPFGQLSTPLCIKPLPPWEARNLLLRPLKYVGFELSGDNHMETILTNSNYYPGILQFFGYTLIQTLQTQYNDFYASTKNNPPYKLEDKQLGAIMNSQDLNRAIQSKIRLTLELDERYFMLARCITLLYQYQEEKAKKGYSKEEITEMANLYEIHCLENLHGQELEALLEEMVDMGILSSPDESLYRLRRREAFIDVIGPSLEKLENDINENNHSYTGDKNDV